MGLVVGLGVRAGVVEGGGVDEVVCVGGERGMDRWWGWRRGGTRTGTLSLVAGSRQLR